MKKIILIFCLFSMLVNAQEVKKEHDKNSTINEENRVEINLDTKIENQDLQNYFDFENIGQFDFKFNGKLLKNKSYVLKLKEFENGNLTNTFTLFDERNNNYFKIDSTSMSFKLFTKIDAKELKIWIRGKSFGSKKSLFKIQEKNKFKYIVKDFIGGRSPFIKDISKPFYLLAAITPYISKNGTGQYCGVAYSDIEPEKFGKKFNIPHYFLIQIEFI